MMLRERVGPGNEFNRSVAAWRQLHDIGRKLPVRHLIYRGESVADPLVLDAETASTSYLAGETTTSAGSLAPPPWAK
jgi:hypothetical protein